MYESAPPPSVQWAGPPQAHTGPMHSGCIAAGSSMPMVGTGPAHGGAPAGPNPFATVLPPGSQLQGSMPLPTGTSVASGSPPPATFRQGPPEVHRTYVTVKLPAPRYPGASTFYGNIPSRAATFAWPELCVTPGPDCSLAPSPDVAGKQWFNSYVYIPEQRSHLERQFLDRFVQGPNGEWIDAVKARRMTNFLEQKREAAMHNSEEQAMVMSGSVVHPTRFTHAYTGQRLLSCRGELLTKQELLEEYHLHPTGAKLREMVQETEPLFDWDNLRINWPFDSADRNKKVSLETYDRFDRRSVYVPTDRSVELMELPSMYVERQVYERW